MLNFIFLRNTSSMTIKISLTLCILIFLLKVFSIFFTNFDLFGDEAQYWAWSKELDFGYYSKPPLLAWLIAFFTIIFGDNFEAIKIIPSLIYLMSTCVIYMISLKLFKNSKEALLTSLIFYLLPAVTVSSFLISTDVLLVLFWSLSLFFMLMIRENPKIKNFIILGIFLGLAFLTKYAAIYFVLSAFIIILIDVRLKNIFLQQKKYFVVSFLVILLIAAPNIIWNFQNNWITFSHTSDNAALNRVGFNLSNGLEFIAAQFLMLGPISLLLFLVFFKKNKLTFETKFLLSFSLPIFLIIFVESILVRANANWAAVALISFLIFLTNYTYVISKKIIVISIFINFLFAAIFYFFISFTMSFNFLDRINGISSFAFDLKRNYMQKTNILVVSDRLLFSNLKYLFKDSNITLLTPHNTKNQIKSHFQLTAPLLSSSKKNFIFLGEPNQISYLQNKYLINKKGSEKVLFKKNIIEIYEVDF